MISPRVSPEDHALMFGHLKNDAGLLRAENEGRVIEALGRPDLREIQLTRSIKSL